MVQESLEVVTGTDEETVVEYTKVENQTYEVRVTKGQKDGTLQKDETP